MFTIRITYASLSEIEKALEVLAREFKIVQISSTSNGGEDNQYADVYVDVEAKEVH